ncbi:MAG TPA: ABC transporter substrate-binding protein [Thermomicrobiales bacterium]|nr:ABC transporter substrate-binding protein [Thermomicrobiales bacterium]
MARRPNRDLETVLAGFQAGLISRRRLMQIAAATPAVAAALAASGELRALPALAAPARSIRRQDQGKPGGTLAMAYSQAVADTLNQHRSNYTTSRMVARHVLDCLVAVDPKDGTVHPWLAESWEVSPDGLQYTFKLRNDVKFHDGTPFNAAAVKRNFDDSMDPNQRPGFAYQAMGGTSYDKTEVVDDSTVRVDFKKPFAAFLLYLSDGGTGIDSPTALDKYGDQYGISALVGSGPFKFVEWVKDDHVTLEKNPDYNWAGEVFSHTGPAYLDQLIFREVPEASVRAQAVLGGEIDMARIVEPNVPDVKDQPGVTIIATPKAGTTRMYLMNTAKAPLNDIVVRKAVNMALDKQAMLQLPGWAGYGRPGLAPLPSNMVPKGDLSSLKEYDIPYDLEGAKKALDEAGWVAGGDGIRAKDGKQLVFDMVCAKDDVDAGQIEPLDTFINPAGMKLNIRSGDFNFWIDTVQKLDFDMTLMSDSGYIAVGLIQEFFRAGEPFANYGVDVPAVNTAIDAAVAAKSLDEQWKQLFVAMAGILKDVPGVMAWEQDYLDAASDKVKGISYNEVGFPYFYPTWKE